MGFFSFQHQNPFLLDSPIYDYPSHDETFKMQFLPAQQVEDMGNNASSSMECGSSSIGASTPLIPSSPSSSLVAAPHPCERAAIKPQYKKRKSRCGSSLGSSQSKESKESSKARKVRNEENKAKNGVKSEAKSSDQEPPKGYIHVRARRGQATDSHSLAERVRRERISERMRMLQGLVPGCDKVTGKALMLDEIINYVQSLQNQVEFLSMKLASMSPIFYGLGSDFDGLVDQAQGCSPNFEKYSSESMSVTIPCVHPEGALGDYPMTSNSTSLSLQNQGPISFSQDTGNFLMQVGDQRQGLLNQVVFNDMCSFQWREKEKDLF